jgi:Tfp pilus assembly protein PilN
VRAVNLIPADQRTDAAIGSGRSQGAAYAVLALVGGVALLALLYGMARHHVSSDKAKAATLNAKYQQIQSTAQGLASYSSFIAMREERVRAVAQLIESRFDWAHAFHELGRVLPKDVSIESLDGTVGESGKGSSSSSSSAPAAKGSSGSTGSTGSTGATGASSASAVASATPPGSVPQFTLQGCATSQAEVARTLNRLRLIDGVNEVTLESSTKSASSGSSSGSSAECTATAFAIQVTFEPLPGAAAQGSTTAAPVSTSGGAR